MESIREGVFFTTPEPLPRGRHAVDRDEARERQRERLMIAATELVAEHGARAVGVREISAHAGVSRAAFYDCFADKDACFHAAYDRFIGVLTERMLAAITEREDWQVLVRDVIGAYLGTLSADPVVGRAFQVEMDTLGRPARERRRGALTAMATLMKEHRDAFWPGAEGVPVEAYLACTYATRQLACDRMDDGGDPLDLLPDAARWVAELLERPLA